MDDQAPASQAQPVAAEASSVTQSPSVEPTTSVSNGAASQTQTVTDDTAQQTQGQQQTGEAERQPSRAERRINQLTGQLKQVTASQQATVPLPTVSPQVPRLSEMLQGRESIDPAELDQIGQRVVQGAVQTARGLNSLEVQQLRQEITQQRAVDEVEKDAAILPVQYDELNPDSPKYNPILEEKIEAAFKARAVVRNPYNPSQVMVDPSVRLSDVAKDYVEVARAAAEQGRSQTNAALAQQVDTGALTPTTNTVAEKSVADMSLAEHEAYLKAKGYDL
jgi:hypothetical protein